MAQSLTFIRENGRIPKTLPSKDHLSGMIFYTADGVLPAKWGTNPIRMFGSIDEVKELGITSESSAALSVRMIHYHLQSFWGANPGATLYVGIFAKKAGEHPFEELKKMQDYSGGELRQVGIWDGYTAINETNMIALQTAATELETLDTPLSVLYSPLVEEISAMEFNFAVKNRRNISVTIGQDCEGTASVLHAEFDKLTPKASVGAMGIVLGQISKSAVHESIAWVSKFPVGVALPGFADGSLLRETSKALIKKLDVDGRYLFFTTYNGLNGVYMNDSHNLDDATSDYCQIELVRTMDKAVRGIRTYLLPELGRPLYIDPTSGKLAPETVKHLENVANKQLEDMEKAGNLSGWKVEIDPDQNVLATSEVEFVIDNVPVGVFRKGTVKIGFAQSI